MKLTDENREYFNTLGINVCKAIYDSVFEKYVYRIMPMNHLEAAKFNGTKDFYVISNGDDIYINKYKCLRNMCKNYRGDFKFKEDFIHSHSFLNRVNTALYSINACEDTYVGNNSVIYAGKKYFNNITLDTFCKFNIYRLKEIVGVDEIDENRKTCVRIKLDDNIPTIGENEDGTKYMDLEIGYDLGAGLIRLIMMKFGVNDILKYYNNFDDKLINDIMVGSLDTYKELYDENATVYSIFNYIMTKFNNSNIYKICNMLLFNIPTDLDACYTSFIFSGESEEEALGKYNTWFKMVNPKVRYFFWLPIKINDDGSRRVNILIVLDNKPYNE